MSTIIIITPPPTEPKKAERTAPQASLTIHGDDSNVEAVEGAIEALTAYLNSRKASGC